MACECGGSQYFTVAELDGRERVVMKCSVCGKLARDPAGSDR